MIISATVVKRPRVFRLCEECGFSISSDALKLFGMAHQEEKPFNIYLHVDCIDDRIDLSQEPKIEAALNGRKDER